ncbi:MAG TPA: PIN domain-containing protein [Longimicrobiaceae bacterium]|nr:PIN domain-containing protein [Longimicrobiaceae bacterium]
MAVDTNVIFSALLKGEGRFAEVLLRSEHAFYVCESVLVELFKHKEKILRLSRLEEDDLVRFYHVLLRRLHIHREELIAPGHWRSARDLCREVDESDIPHVALTLELGGLLWTGDRHLREGLAARGFDRFFSPGT